MSQRDVIAGDTDDLGEILKDLDAGQGQFGHGRFGELGAEALDGIGRSQS